MAKYHWYDNAASKLQVVEVSTATPPLGSGVWLSGHGAPPAGSGLLPLDGVNDPWRWAPGPYWGGWIGPAYHVTVAADASFLTDQVLEKSGSMAELTLFLTTATTLRDVQQLGEQSALFRKAYKDPEVFGSGSLASSVEYGVDLPPQEAGRVFHAVTAADGIAFLVQYEAEWGGPTAVPDATVDTLAALEALGAVTVGEPFEFSEMTPVGESGQLWFDKDTRDVYLRDGTSWTKVSTLPAPA